MPHRLEWCKSDVSQTHNFWDINKNILILYSTFNAWYVRKGGWQSVGGNGKGNCYIFYVIFNYMPCGCTIGLRDINFSNKLWYSSINMNELHPHGFAWSWNMLQKTVFWTTFVLTYSSWVFEIFAKNYYYYYIVICLYVRGRGSVCVSTEPPLIYCFCTHVVVTDRQCI